MESFAGWAVGGGGLVAFGTTDSLLERVDAAVTAVCGAGAGAGGPGDVDSSVPEGKSGDTRAGVVWPLAAFD